MGGFFKRGEIVTIGKNPKRWCIDRIRESVDASAESYLMADLSDERGKTTSAETSRLTKVAG